jgi:uncharacterized membrane protein (UPF0127 family)
MTPACLTGVLLFAALGGCIGSSDGAGKAGTGHSSAELRQFPLETLPTAIVSIDEHELRVWLATNSEQQLEGMMHVSEDEVADDQGMLFVFPYEYPHSFWMKDTIIPLDIAYARADGTIVRIWTMPPLTYRTFPSIEPAMFALEVKAGTFERLGICEGDRIIIPDEVFKASP